ncbi:MAG: family 20 glycosylhydrolase [Flavobacteriales bacterium]
MRFTLILLILLASSVKAQRPEILPSLIPLPAEMVVTGGTCSLECPWSFHPDRTISTEFMELLKAEVEPLHGTPEVLCEVPLRIELHRIQPDTLLPSEWYSLRVASDHITLTATTEEGLLRGSRTLIQLLEEGKGTGSIPCLSITDEPRFAWRGMHLDVARHFFPVPFVKKYIDLLARYKMNSFHWHLTDDQGWRIEIKKYPKLTEVGGWRKGSQVGPYGRMEYDSIPYGGFYTQDEIREVVAYAKARHINVVPEIEMPGHAMAALAAYPQLGCTGGPYEVQRGWGVFDDVFCAGNDTVFTVLEDVLTEVMALFPSPYIHIGGDECPKERWKTCPKCQARMKAEGLKDEHELQSYFIQRIEKFVNSKGRKIIGWDEILEGGLAPNAAVMSWRGNEGGVAAAKSGHYAVMTPGGYCYFDHYQGDPSNEPLAIGGYTTVQKVYSYEPIPAELNAEEAKYILGAQGNVWTEYILTPEQVEYMAVPRMLALAEVLWSPKEKRDEADFITRLEEEFPRLDAMNVNYAKSLYEVQFRLDHGSVPGTIKIELYTAVAGTIGYTDTDSAGVLKYATPFAITGSGRTITAGLYEERGNFPKTSSRTFHFNLATARPITLSEQPDEQYNNGGAFTLVDGITAQEKRVNTEWLGWRKGVTITVDLGSEQKIGHIGIGALNETHNWIQLPKEVVFSVSSDGKKFVPYGIAKSKGGVGRNDLSIDKPGKARYVRIDVQHIGNIPEGFAGAGNPAWLFLDEIEVR